jgi:hypothetical protein
MIDLYHCQQMLRLTIQYITIRVNNLWSRVRGYLYTDRLQTVLKVFWRPVYAKQTAIPSMHRLENEHQRSVNNWWLCILGNLGGTMLQTVMNTALTAFIRKRETDMLPAPS